MLTNDDIANVLETVADNYESGLFGWHRKSYANSDETAFCAMGAIRKVHCGTVYGSIASGRLREAIAITDYLSKVLYKTGFGSVPAWNDHPECTKEEVIEAFKQAAKDVRNANQ